MRLSDSLSSSVYMNMFSKYLLRSFEIFRKMSQKCEQFSYDLFFCDFGGIGVGFVGSWMAPPHPIPGVNVKVPFRKKKYVKQNVFYIFVMIFMEKIKKWY